jgi:amino acid adenylation domain-containing protein/FkbH-like protein
MERVEEMATAYVRDLRAFQPSGPYRLGGYCFGGLVAYEMARQLEQDGKKVELLALFNCSPPNSSYTRIPATPIWVWRFVRNLGYWVNYMRGWTPGQRRGFVRWKFEQWTRKLALVRGAGAHHREQISIGDLVDLSGFSIEERRVWEAHIRALLKYQPRAYDGAVHLFRSPGHPLWCSYEPDYGWGPLARGGVILTIVPGAHEKILEEPCVEAIASEMKELLAQGTKVEPNRAGKQAVPAGDGSCDRSRPDADTFRWDRACGDSSPRKRRGPIATTPQLGLEELARVWKNRLDDAPALLELPCDHSRPAAQTCRAGEAETVFPARSAAGILRLSASLGITEADLLMAAIKALLFRYSGQEHILLGEDSGELVVVGSHVTGSLSFLDLATHIRAARLEASEHTLPFPKLVEELNAVCDPSYHPIVQVLFRYGRDNAAKVTSTRFDLEARFTRDGESLRARIVYALDLFEAGTIERMLGHLQTLLDDAIAHPDKQVADLALLTCQERHTLLTDWTATERPLPANKMITDLFEEQAERSPTAEALVCGDTRWTYSELGARADAIAHRLRSMGVERGDLVGICLGRSADLVAAILGTLKAGAAYVPMDPAYPTERLAYMLADAKAGIVISDKKVGGVIPDGVAQAVFVEEIESSNGPKQGLPPDNRNEGNGARELAYVIYTSGSTGQPKGVAIEHCSVVAFVSWAREVFTPEELSGVLAATSICFDLSVFEMFVPLSWGGKIVVAENALALPSLAAATEVRLINTVPSAMRELVRIKGIPDTVKVVNLAGEPLSTELVDAIYGQTGVSKVYDLYGPTETTTYSTFTLRQPAKKPMIGRPLSNEQVYLLDSRMQPVPIGVPGELHIGGAGLARGYLNRPELTNEKFIPNPFKHGTRLYKTGDLARWRADGNIEFLGRRDNQVKVRGFRIEPGEVEAVLKRQKGVQDAVVLVREDQPGQKRLIAYIASPNYSEVGRNNGTSGRTKEHLREALLKTLPEYMLPAALVLLPALPLMPNGKVNRKALPAPEMDRIDHTGEIEQPASATQKQIANIWHEVLRINDPGVDENFFEVGGDSLQAIQVISRIQEQFRMRLPVTSMFEAPTVRELANGIDTNRWGVAGEAEAPIRRASREQCPQASFVQERLYFFDQLLPGSNANNVPTGWRLKGKLDLARLEQALNHIVQRHEALRTSFQFQDGTLRQVISPQLFVPIRFSDLEAGASDEDAEVRANEFARDEARGLFDLANGPLIRASVARIAPEDHLFLVVMHHCICDGWSLGILFRELEEVYRVSMSTTEPELLDLPVQYVDFSAWQRQTIQGGLLQKELAYWKESLAGAPPELDLPCERPVADVSMQAAHCELRLTADLSRELARFSHSGIGTTFHPLMAALAITLHKWTRQEDMVIGTVVAGRNRRETENVIGCFMNFLPIRMQVSPAEAAAAVLARSRTAVVQAQNHQDCPFEKIVEAINPERRPNRNPLYNVGLLFQNFPMHGFLHDDLAAKSSPVPAESTVLDLRFEVEQDDAGFRLFCEYKADLFDQATMEHVLASLHQTLRLLIHAPQTRISEFSTLAEAGVVEWEPPRPETAIRIAATFTAEPLGEPLQFWIRELGLKNVVEFAPYNQVFQQLLDQKSMLMRNRAGLNVLLIRLEDWEAGPVCAAGPVAAGLDRNVCEFLAALKAAVAKAESPWLVCLCPTSPCSRANASLSALLNATEQRLIAELEALSSVHVLRAEELEKLYPVENCYDTASEELGHVPYTSQWFTAMASGIARKYHALNRPPCKVIALDCDNTLWGGICGEDGPARLRLDEPYLALQKFMVAQTEAGMVLCACSKNNEQDVREVFAQRREMPLREEHFAAWRLNWAPKSQNLKALAQELGLGLDSFVFIDDNPLECAEVEANCPGVLCLELPQDPQDIPAFLEHCWVFDRVKVTSEDKRRTEMYRQNRQREQWRSESLSLGEFVEGLGLHIEIQPLPAPGETGSHKMTPAELLARVSQLTQRTNQFNFTTRRRAEAELQKLAQSVEILTVSISDRFGDYGLTGAMFFEAKQGSLDVDTFLLSCRVLGRGVEHRMLARLGEIARERNLNWLDVHFIPSSKNRPALEFVESVGAPFRQARNGGYLFRFPAAYAAEVTLELRSCEPERPVSEHQTAKSAREEGRARAKSAPGIGTQEHGLPIDPDWRPIRGSRYRRIALELNTAAAIHQALEARSLARPVKRTGYTAPQTEAEKQLCTMWAKLLRVDEVGVRDDFFELGGHSLLAVRLFADIETVFGKKLPLVTLFQSPTVAQLARALEDSGDISGDSLLVPLQPQGSQSPLFLVHGAGGDVLWGYANLTSHLPADQPVYGIKSRGQAGGEEFSRIEEMAACYVNEIRRRQSRGPYYLGGYCFGGNVAYEMARQLRAQGERIALLALLDAAPMNAGYERVPWWRPQYALRFARNLGYWLADFMAQTPKERWNFALRKLRTVGRKLLRRITRRSRTVDLEEVIDPALFPSNELKLWEKHLQALIGHADRPYEGDVLLLRTRGQPLFCSLEDDFCWKRLVHGKVQTVLTPGSHENIFMEPNVEALAQRLKAGLAEARQPLECGAESK